MQEVTREQVVAEVAAIAFGNGPEGPRTADKLRALDMLGAWLNIGQDAPEPVTIIDDLPDPVPGDDELPV